MLRFLERTSIPRERITCAVSSEGPLSEEIVKLGYGVYSARIPIPGLEKNIIDKIVSWVGLIRYCFGLAGTVRKKKIELLYANNHRSGFILAALKKFCPGTRLVVHIRDRIDGVLKTKVLVGASDRLIVISQYVTQGLGIDSSRAGLVTRIPSGVDTDIFRYNQKDSRIRKTLGIPEGSFVFGLFCQVLPWKGIREYIEACIITAGPCPEAFFIMVGDDSFSEETSYFTEVKRRVIESELEGRIIFTGFKKDVENYISCVDVVVSTSFGEPLGQTLLQAMVLGKPVIATRSGGPLEIVADGETGLLVEPADISSLSEAMKKLYNNRETAVRMGSRGKARFSEHFLTAGEMTAKIDGVLLENPGSRG